MKNILYYSTNQYNILCIPLLQFESKKIESYNIYSLTIHNKFNMIHYNTPRLVLEMHIIICKENN